MTQLTIVTTPTNSGDGTPLATAFNYCNSNFNELYARFQVDPPVSLIGTTGDVPGMYAVDSTYFYYCFDAYDGSSTIWGQVTQVGNISVSSISSGTSNVKISDVNGNATTSIGGTSNVVVVAGTGQYITGLISATGNIRGNYLLGNGSQLTGLPQSYSNSNVVSLLSAFGSNVISTTGTITSGNITGGNVLTGGRVSATGNIVTDQYFVGNFFGNITGNFVVPGSNTQVIFNTSGNADATAGMTFNKDSNTFIVLGVVSSQGNVIAGNVSTTGNVTGGNLIGTLATAAQTNITSVGTLSSVTVTANVAGGNLTTGGQVSATGNIRTANYLFVSQDVNVGGDITSTSYTGSTISLSGNVTGGNVRTGGLISATGNITGNYFLGNIAFTSGLPSTNTIQNGNSNVLIGSSAGNVSINVNGISPIVIVTPVGMALTGDLSATLSITGGNLLTGGVVSATGEITGANVRTNGFVSATGNVVAGNLFSGFQIAATNNISGANFNTVGTVNATGTITGGNLTTAGILTVNSGNAVTAIVNGGGNGVGNIGSSSAYFNTVFALATSAQYADLAENYTTDADYAPGTVVVFGGEQEITMTDQVADERVAGVVSTKPAYLMNSGEPGLPVALRGKVPVQVVGPVNKGDSLVTSSTPGVAISVGRSREYAQAVFAKSLETDNCPDKKIILAVIL
jgi:hypothetical protein